MATSQIDLCNRALRRLGTQSIITSLSDGSTEADTCADLYDDVLGSLLQAPRCSAYPTYTWQWCRRIASGVSSASTNPRWAYEYALPSDCLRVQEIIDPAFPQNKWHPNQRLTAGVTDYACGIGQINGTDTPVIWCNLSPLSIMYVSSGISIDQWPYAFRRAFWLSLAAEIGTSLGVSGSILGVISQEADAATAQACQQDMSITTQSTDYVPDWIAARGMRCDYDGQDPRQSLSSYPSGFIVGDSYANAPTPNYLVPSTGANGVSATGLQPRDIGDRLNQYISADTPDGRIGVLGIGASPVGWRRPYHNTIELGAEPGDGETKE